MTDRVPSGVVEPDAEERVASTETAEPDRRSRRSAVRTRRRRRVAISAVAVVAVTAAAIVGAAYVDRALLDEPTRNRVTSTGRPSSLARFADTTLVFGTHPRQEGGGSAIDWVTLFIRDTEHGRGTVLYVPAHTATEVPGRGLLPLASAFSSGGARLLEVSTENLLGITVDRSIELPDSVARELFAGVEPLSVDVPVEVRVSDGRDQARLLISAGVQELSAQQIVDLLYTGGLDSDDAELGSRHLAFWQAYLASGRLSEDDLETALDDAGLGARAEDGLVEALGSLGSLREADRDLIVLPVEQAGTGDEQLFMVDAAQTRALLGSLLDPGVGDDQQDRVQVLNGNGRPGVGAEVGERLVQGGFRVVLSGNARRLDYRKTLVITYDRSPEGLDMAEQARDLLGVGEVQVAAQPQGIVNLTIVVGKDYLRRES
jgi:LytR cell envelope-related transcriptional attenuator